MAQINITNLSFNYDGSADSVFENVNLCLDTDWRLGLIGRNGRGKTTLLKLLCGIYEYSGKITTNVEFEYYPYNVKNTRDIVYNIICEICTAQQWEMERELSLLELRNDILWREFDTLSNGERTKVMLAALFLRENAFLLIDEPTNHLDEKTRGVVAEYLKRKKGFILVSHDRQLLDSCTDHILSINRKSIEIRQGNFSSWEQNRAAQDAFEAAQNEKLTHEIQRLRAAARHSAQISEGIEKTKKGTRTAGLRPDRGFIGHKSAKMMKRAKVIEKRRENAIEQKSSLLQDTEKSENLKLSPLQSAKNPILTVKNLSCMYNDLIINNPVSFEISTGMRVALRGKNGCGKSSILRLICGEDIKHEGGIFKISGLKISYIPQDASFLCGGLSDYAKLRGIDESIFKTILRKLDFERVQFEKNMEEFSQGQKKKVLLAASLCESAHLYIWDEPLNFIDVISRIQIERLLQKYMPTMLFVEHDGTFVNKIATDIIEML